MMWKDYLSSSTLEEALQALANPGSKIVAGATDLMLEMEAGNHPDLKILVDVTRIAGLDQILLDEQGWLHLGPLVTHNDCANSALVIEHAFALAQACWQVGIPQIRTRGTIAGNLITASPANDSIPPLVALGAELTLRSARGERHIRLEDFYTGVRMRQIEPDEMLVDIAFPALGAGERSAFYKLGLRRSHAISLVNAAAVLRFDGKLVTSATLTLGAVAPTIVHASEAEEFLVGKQLTKEVISAAGELAARAARPIDDVRASSDYRRAMARLCAMRSLKSLAEATEREQYPTRRVLLEEKVRARKPLKETIRHTPGGRIETTVNGQHFSVQVRVGKTLLQMLREDLLLTGTKEGCGEGECGACTVILDGQAVLACLVPAPRAHGAEIRTVEGVEQDGLLHPLQRSFIEQGAVQCGFCTPGFVMSGVMLLEEIEQPTLDEIKTAVSGNLCRCTGYYKILTAIQNAAEGSN